ncbi:MAG: hypothetical protein ABIP94_25005 [Planctomycetota bacterium]
MLYGLYTNDDDELRPVVTKADKDLETALRSFDTNRRVTQVADTVSQGHLLRAYVVSVPFELPVNGHVIAFHDAEDSKYDPISRSWITLLSGASIRYSVHPSGVPPTAARLFLPAWTIVDQGGDGSGLRRVGSGLARRAHTLHSAAR